MKENYFNVGKVVNTHGVRGEVRIISTTDFDERFAPGHTLYFFNDQQSEPVVLPFIRIGSITIRFIDL